MGRGAGSRAISREEKRLKKEKEKRIREANRMLIPVPKSTVSSMHLVGFDPAGTFQFEGGSWKRVYRVISHENAALGTIAKDIKAAARFTQVIGAGGGVETFMTLTQTGDTYDEVRALFADDESKITKHMQFEVLSVDEAMKAVSGYGCHFSYASMVRGRKDWKRECMAEIVDQTDFGRTLEQRFNKHGLNANEFINSSMTIMFTCDSDDARAIIEKTILSILSAEGFIIAPCVGAQKKAAEAAISFGLLNLTYVRNVRVDLADQIEMFGGLKDGSD
ncbi:MAG: hypothetical protein U0K68_03665 [Agathobacter sp.]|nr:hypothetical protein [Agathobacter sp.]